MRIFSHTCSNTEIVCALGCAGELVGVDADSDYPADVVGALPKMGRDLTLDVEAVRRLAPDLVLSSLTVPGHGRVVAALQVAGLRTLVCDPQSLDDVYADIRRIATALGVVERGETLVASMQAAMPVFAPAGRRPRVLVEWWPKPVIAAARQSWITDMIWRAGGSNPWGEVAARSVPLTHADAAAQRPDVVVMSWCGVKVEHYRADKVRTREGWAEVPAVVHDRIVAISEAFLGRPGPRLVEGYRRLRAAIAAWHLRPDVPTPNVLIPDILRIPPLPGNPFPFGGEGAPEASTHKPPGVDIPSRPYNHRPFPAAHRYARKPPGMLPAKRPKTPPATDTATTYQTPPLQQLHAGPPACAGARGVAQCRA